MARERDWLARVRRLCRVLAEATDLDKLFASIIEAAIELTGAERGFLVLVHYKDDNSAPSIHIEEARGFHHTELGGSKGAVSRTVVQRVMEQKRGLVTSHAQDADLLNVTSVRSQDVLSIISAPLNLRGEIRGALYLDHRSHSLAFSEDDLPILETFADQAALTLETIELRKKGALSHSLELEGGCFGALVGQSPAMQKLYESIERFARTFEHVLILGESGTGKEIVAKELHRRGERRDQPFIAENCGAFSESLLESELFGHEKGAFSGAYQDHTGLFERAGTGTLFLDEVGEMSLRMQVKLLRVLQERRIRPVGSLRLVPIHCRVVAATHRNLPEMVRSGEFREDLYYRLDVLRLPVPPLRARAEDIPALCAEFSRRCGLQLDFALRTMKSLQAWSWPGNVRELENEIKRLSIDGSRKVLQRELSEAIQLGRGVASARIKTSGQTLDEVEKSMVLEALRASGGNKSAAARQLGVRRTSLYRLIERYQLGDLE
jgi:transcriptional regulator with GAF, ATPase, and Fis domain